MTSQLVVVPTELDALARILEATAADIEQAERWIRTELAAVRLNPADPWFSPSNLNGRAANTSRALQFAVRQTSDEASQVTDARLQAVAADTAAASSVGDFIIDYLLGDVAAFWGRQSDRLDLASMATGGIRVVRTGIYLASGMNEKKLPVFNTGFVGRQLAAGLQRVPRLAGAGIWLESGAATTFFRRAGIVGAVAGTGMGLYDLYQQGNPVEAFQREGAGYVADVANTAFSASTAAFLLCPTNPVAGAAVIITGTIWLGAEIVDNWDDISAAASDAWEAGSDFVAGAGSAALDVASDTVGAIADGAGALVDGAGSLVGGIGGAISDWF